MIIALKEARQKYNYTYQRMARKLGISKSYYWQLEHGERRLLYSTAIEIAKVLKCSTDELFYNHYMEKLELKGNIQYASKTKTH